MKLTLKYQLLQFYCRFLLGATGYHQGLVPFNILFHVAAGKMRPKRDWRHSYTGQWSFGLFNQQSSLQIGQHGDTRDSTDIAPLAVSAVLTLNLTSDLTAVLTLNLT